MAIAPFFITSVGGSACGALANPFAVAFGGNVHFHAAGTAVHLHGHVIAAWAILTVHYHGHFARCARVGTRHFR